MKRLHLVVTVAVALLTVTLVSYTSQASLAAPATSLQSGAVMFIENAGQFTEGARFQVRGGDRTIWLTGEAIWITVLGSSDTQAETESKRLLDDAISRPGSESAAMPDLGVHLRLSFVGANPLPEMEPFHPLDTTISYFIGNDPDRWAAGVPVWGGVRYADLYPGLDLKLGSDGGIRLVCRAANCQDSLEQVQLQVDGADSLALMDDGLVIETAAGDFSMPWLEVVDGQGRPGV